MERIVYSSLLIAVVLLVTSCNGKFNGAGRESEYDSLFLGISLGMGKKEFYDHCWEYNRQKVFTHGPTNQNVEYRLATELNSPVLMRFYPTFHEDKIFEMPVIFTYESWAPWARQLKSDTLLVHLLPLFKKWYGDDFKELDHPIQGKVYYKMDGKRRINLFIKDDQYVQAVFTDLKVEKKLNEEFEKEFNKESTTGQQ